MPAPMGIGRRDNGFSDPSRSPLMHPALSNSLSRSFGMNSPFSLSALSTSLTMLSSSPSFSNMGMSLGRSFEERPKLEAQFFRNFSCCGLDLQDLHGLLEHFEECHVAFDDADGGDMDLDNGSDGTISGPASPRLGPTGGMGIGGNNGDPSMDLDMELDDVPFEHHSLSSSHNKKKFSTAMNPLRGTTSNSTVGPGVPIGVNPAGVSGGLPPTPPVEIDLPVVEGPGLFGVQAGLAPNVGLAPSLLFPGTPADSPPSDEGGSPGGGRASSSSSRESDHDLGIGGSNGGVSPASISAGLSTPNSSLSLFQKQQQLQQLQQQQQNNPNQPMTPLSALQPSQLSALHPLGTGIQISPSGRPYTPPSEKPFKCSVAGCDKSYKQQNGLKYHRLHGHCNQNNVGREGENDRGEGKPYVCHVVSCGKRYKNMNGLRYHYQHSGAHGALGLQMLAQAVHPPPQFPPGHKRAGGSSTGHSPHQSRDSSPAGFPRTTGGIAGALGLTPQQQQPATQPQQQQTQQQQQPMAMQPPPSTPMNMNGVKAPNGFSQTTPIQMGAPTSATLV